MNKPETTSSESSFVFHPYNILMILSIGSLSVLFLALTVSFTYSRVQNGDAMPAIVLPPIFLLNTIILLGSSATMYWAKQCYLKDQTGNYQKALLATILLSLLFMVSQYFGWRTLFSNEIFIHSDISASYLYLISFLHFAHVIAGLPFLILFLRAAKRRMKEPVSVLIYFSDPEKRLKLRLLTVYWHFLDALWIYLVLFFFINSLI